VTTHFSLFTNTKHKRYDHGDPPTDHAIIHISPHTWAITPKPFLLPSQRLYAPSDASAVLVPLPIAHPQPMTITNSEIHDFDTSRPPQVHAEAISPPIGTKQLLLTFD
jgi:hypothetical protein